MSRDTIAVPATGAGVEREFKKPGRMATWMRSRLNPNIICEIMRYKNYLSRIGKPMTPLQHTSPLDRSSIDNEIEDEVDNGFEMKDVENDEDEIVMPEWEAEWWQKEGTVIICNVITFKIERLSRELNTHEISRGIIAIHVISAHYILQSNVHSRIRELQNEFCTLYFSNFFESNRIHNFDSLASLLTPNPHYFMTINNNDRDQGSGHARSKTSEIHWRIA